MFWKREEAEVLVVGAGPVGMMTALMLAERGIRVEIIDSSSGSWRHNYALVLQEPALEILDDVGLASALVGKGAKVERLVLHDRGSERGLPVGHAANGFPFLLVLPRLALESALEERLHARKVPIHWNQRLDALQDGDDGVSVTIQTLSVESAGYPIGGHLYCVDRVRQHHPRFVIGADGSDSIVRRRMDIDAETTGASELFAALEVETAFGLDRDAHVVMDEDTTSVLWPLPDHRCRWTLEVRGTTAAPDGEPPMSRRQIGELVGSRAPWFLEGQADAEWAALLQFAPALATRFGRGHVWLVGDAAHVTGSIGIPDLNEGLHEAHDLAARIARVVRGEASLNLVDEYDDERRAAWRAPPAAEGLLGYLARAHA
jgi:2-polyprenyl-6-methoxyphenol hydroxylase-like FAD-dependent oxidoreductase